jgi:hypothetical protein
MSETFETAIPILKNNNDLEKNEEKKSTLNIIKEQNLLTIDNIYNLTQILKTIETKIYDLELQIDAYSEKLIKLYEENHKPKISRVKKQ